VSLQPESKHAPFLLLFVPIAAVASLVALSALAEGVKVSNPALPAPDSGAVAEAAVDAGAASVAEDASEPDAGDDEESVAEFDGHIPDIDRLAPYPKDADLLGHAQLGDDGIYRAEQGGKTVALTLDSVLQKKVKKLLRNYNPPYAAVAAIDPATGRVLALVQSSRDEGVRDLSLRAVYPAASVFKLVTASALLEHGVDPNREVCYHGGKHRIQKKLLEDSPRDHTCFDMGSALAYSANVVFAKLAHRHLSPEDLRAEASKWGFNRALEFDQPVEKSPANIPDTPFEFATTAAGFGQVFLSPLHAALLAATVGNRGVMPEPTLVQSSSIEPGRRVLDAKLAGEIAGMMERTVSEGTARRSFREHGRYVLDVDAAGKTGSLDDRHPFHDYTWFVGFAPKDHPTIAVAAVVVNDLVWRIRAPYIARETLRYYLDEKPPHAVQARR